MSGDRAPDVTYSWPERACNAGSSPRSRPLLAIAFTRAAPIIAVQPGRTLFVSPKVDDGQSGKEVQPFRTIRHAVDIVVGGETVIVEDGPQPCRRFRPPSGHR
jgi:hypothetical protein